MSKPITRPGAMYQRDLGDGREIVIYPMLFTSRLCIGPTEGLTYDDAWCYEDLPTCIEQAGLWDGAGEPEGWHRHPASGRRRPNGDPQEEYVRP